MTQAIPNSAFLADDLTSRKILAICPTRDQLQMVSGLREKGGETQAILVAELDDLTSLQSSPTEFDAWILVADTPPPAEALSGLGDARHESWIVVPGEQSGSRLIALSSEGDVEVQDFLHAASPPRLAALAHADDCFSQQQASGVLVVGACDRLEGQDATFNAITNLLSRPP